MFWRLNLEPNRKYSQTIEKYLHISQAALDSESSEGDDTEILISSENQKVFICTLRKEVREQVMLDLYFAAGTEICFQSLGSGNVTLCGYYVVEKEETEAVEQDLRNVLNEMKAQKNKKADKDKAAKAAAKEEGEDDDDDDEDDSDFDAENPRIGDEQPHNKEQKTGVERVLAGGVKAVDIRIGNGPKAKVGKRTQVYYECRLLSTNKLFGSLKTGAAYKFSLGRGKVIKGLDIGIAGMKVGGKRRLTIPAPMAFGSRGCPPMIPPNSALLCEIELKGVI